MAVAKSFRFPFDPVLRQRRQEEQTIQRQLAEIVRRQLIVETRLQEIQNQIRSGKQDLGIELLGEVNTTVIRVQANMSIQLDMQARQLALGLAEVYHQAEKVREELVHASQRRRAMEILRENRYEQWKMDIKKEEEKEQDDMTMTRMANRSKDGL